MAIIEPGATQPTNTFTPPQDPTKPSVVPQPVGPFDPNNFNTPKPNQAPAPTATPPPTQTPASTATPTPTPTEVVKSESPVLEGGPGGPKVKEELLQKIVDKKAAEEAANTPADTSPTKTDTTVKVNADGTTTTTTEAYTDKVTKEFDTYLRQYNTTLESETKYATDKFNEIARDADASQVRMIEAINASYNVRTEQMKRINEAQLRTTTAIGLRNNRMRYTPDLQNSILTNQERSGISKLAELDAERLRLLAEAQAAAVKEDLAIVSERMDSLAKVRDEQMGVMSKLYGLAVENEERTRLREELNTQTEVQVQKNLIAQIGNLTSLGADLTPVQTEEYATRLGVDNQVITDYITTQREMVAEESEIKKMTNIMKLLNDSPPGMEWTFNINGEEVTYSGQNYDGYTTHKEFNKSTNTTSYVTTDPSGKIVKTETISNVGTPYTATGGNSVRNSLLNSDGSVFTFEQYLSAQEDKMQMSINRENAQYMALLKSEYDQLKSTAGLSEKKLYESVGLSPLTDAARNTAVLNYVALTGNAPTEFSNLSPLEQVRFSKYTKKEIEEMGGATGVDGGTSEPTDSGIEIPDALK